MTDLFQSADEPKRDQLRQLGWRKAADALQAGHPYWWTPDGREKVTEEEAFARLVSGQGS